MQSIALIEINPNQKRCKHSLGVSGFRAFARRKFLSPRWRRLISGGLGICCSGKVSKTRTPFIDWVLRWKSTASLCATNNEPLIKSARRLASKNSKTNPKAGFVSELQ